VRSNLKGIGLRDLIDGFLFSLKAEGRSSRTTKYYADLLRSLLNYAQDNRWPHEVITLDTHRVREFLSWIGSRTVKHKVGNGTRRQRKSKPSTAWPYYRALRRLFNWAVGEGYLETSPLATIRFKPPPAPPIEGYTRDELQRLLAVCDLDTRTGAVFTGIRNKAMLLLFIDAGLRRGELINLKLNDIDLESKRVRVIGTFTGLLSGNMIYRAVEHRIYTAAFYRDNGSILVDPYGRILEDIAPEPEIVAGKIAFTNERSFYSKYGDIFGFTILGLFVALLSYNTYLKRKSPYTFCKECNA